MNRVKAMHRVALGEADAPHLERQLNQAISDVVRGERGLQARTTIDQRKHQKLEHIRNEIIDAHRKGIKIASIAESRPLIPLFQKSHTDIPPEMMQDAEQGYQHYLVQIIFRALLDAGEFLNFAQLDVKLDDDADVPRKSRPLRLFPASQHRSYFTVNLEGAIGLDSALTFAVATDAKGKVSGSADARAGLKGKIAVGPFDFSFTKTDLEVVGEADPEITWRYNSPHALRNACEFKSILILKVDKKAERLSMDARLNVIRCCRRCLIFKQYLPRLTDHITLPVELVP